MACASLAAQTNYYTKTRTFVMEGYTYQCDVDASRMVTLYNQDNQWPNTGPVYTSTGKVYAPDDGEWIPLLEDDTWTRQKRHDIVNNAFSASERQRLKGRRFSITMYINPQTGRVEEVDFTFHVTNPHATIPVAIYRQIETKLKEQVWYTPTAEGRKLNFILLSWRQEPE